MVEYIPLHVHSWFSLLDGVSSPETLIERAKALGFTTLALTDHDNLYGAVQFIQAAKANGIKPLLGAELTLETGHHLTLLATDHNGWKNLSSLISIARMNASKGEAALPKSVLADHTEGIIALSGCRKGEIASAILSHDNDRALTLAREYRDWFGNGQFWIELQNHRLPEDRQLVADLVALAKEIDVGYVATNNVHYAEKDNLQLQDVVVSIRTKTPLADARLLHRPNKEYYLKSASQMSALFRRFPEAIRNSQYIADQCDVDLRYGIQDLPAFPTPNGEPGIVYLRSLCIKGVAGRDSLSERETIRLDKELAVIERKGFTNYFLILWDMVRFGRANNIYIQGRGAIVGSFVAYRLGISSINPLQYDLVFERFLSDERMATADCDFDVDAVRREELIQYVYDCYGRDHAAMASTLVTFGHKLSIRDVGKMLGIPPDTLNTISSYADLHDGRLNSSKLIAPKTLSHLTVLTEEILHFPRHLGIHSGAMVLSQSPISDIVPIEPARKKGRTVIQWDKESLEDVGIVKIDILSLKILAAITETVFLVEQQTGKHIDLDRLTFDDPTVYAMIATADTVGVFQVESRAQTQILPRFKPTCFVDLIIVISLIRPGPIQGDMVHPYLRRRAGQEPVTYFHPLLKPVLEETLGVILFQEQVLKIAAVMAGFTYGEGENLRRALSGKNPEEAIETFHTRFVNGAMQKGVAEETAELVFEKLRGFGGYSFPKSHAAAFAVIVYRSAWLKRYYPAAFLCALLNNQPMGFWSPAILVHDAKRHGIPILPVDANRSHEKCTCEGKGIRIGLNYVKGFGEAACNQVIQARGEMLFTCLAELVRRTRLTKRLARHLIHAGGLDWTGQLRRKLDWELGGLTDDPNQLPITIPEPDVDLPPVSRQHALAVEFGMTGVSLHEHPMELYRSYLKKRRILDSRQVTKTPSEARVDVAGLNVMHQAPPTAKGFHFITLEDEYGFINVIIRPQVYAKYRLIIRTAPHLIVHGTVQREGAVMNMIASSVTTLQ